MKILFCLWDYKSGHDHAMVGGMVKNSAELVNILNRQNTYEIYTTSKDPDFGSSDTKIKILETSKYFGILRFLNRLNIFSNAIEKKTDFQNSIIHAHTPALVPAFLRKKATIICTAHGTHWPEFLANHSVKNIQSFLLFCNAYIQYRIERYVYQGCSCVVSVSDFQVKELIDAYGVEPSKIKVIRNGIDYSRYAKSPKPMADRKYDLLFVGRPVPKKGVDLFVNAAKILKGAYPNLHICAVFGKGWVTHPDISQIYTPALKELGAEIIEDCPEHDLPGLYQDSKILVVPSTGYESLPTVILEAIGTGTIPIASKSFGNKEVLPNEFLFEEGNLEELVSSLSAAINSPDSFEKAMQTIDLYKYSLERCADEHNRLYEEFAK